MTLFKTLKRSEPYKHVLLITFNRPDVSNAFNTEMAWELIQVFEDIALKRHKTRVVVITGEGSKSFCAGGDLKERQGMTDENSELQTTRPQATEFLDQRKLLFLGIHNL